MRYAVETLIGNAWENCWTQDDAPATYATRAEAEQEIKDHICDCINAVEGGDMADSPDPSDYRIIGIAEFNSRLKTLHYLSSHNVEITAHCTSERQAREIIDYTCIEQLLTVKDA